MDRENYERIMLFVEKHGAFCYTDNDYSEMRQRCRYGMSLWCACAVDAGCG